MRTAQLQRGYDQLYQGLELIIQPWLCLYDMKGFFTPSRYVAS